MKQSTMPRFLALAAAAALLAGCKDESASMRLAGPEHALTLVMRQDYPWSKEYRFEAVMVRTPDCHRRSRLDSVAPGEVRVDVHRPPEGVFAEPILILKEGAKHYAVSTQNC
jgi:hypothetical protein